MVTAYDIARRAGVNQSTVSRVLSGFPFVSKKTAGKVRRVCRELGYQPNAMARGLRLGRSEVIAVNIPFGEETVLVDPFIIEFLAGVNRECVRHDYSTILSFVVPGDANIAFNRLLKVRHGDGIILIAPNINDQRIRELIRSDVPFVVGRYEGALKKWLVQVDVDNHDAGRRAAEFLIARGHRRIGAVLEPKGNISGNDFWRGIVEALCCHRILPDERLVRRVAVTVEDTRRATTELIRLARPPTAILVDTPLGIFGAIEARRAMNSSVELLGEDSRLFRSLYPQMPRIHGPTAELGSLMANVLIRMIKTGKRLPSPPMLHAAILDENGREFMPLKN